MLLSSGSAASQPFLPKVTLHTMDTSAAPIAPMIAAALPPPGVGSPLARLLQKFDRSTLDSSQNPSLTDQPTIVLA